MRLLDDPSAASRASTLRRLELTTANISVFQGLLANDLSASVRSEAARSLAHAPATDRQTALNAALADPSPAVRAAAVEAMAEPGTAELEHLVAACNDLDLKVRRAGYRQAAAAPASLTWRVIRDSSRRLEWREALAEHAGEDLAKLAEEGMASDLTEDRILATELAGAAGTPEGLALGVSAVTDVDAAVRSAALTQLRSVEEAAEAVLHAMDDPDSSVRLEAARTLGSLDHDHAVIGLVKGLDDRDMAVRRGCIEALASCASVELARRLAEAMTGSNSEAVVEVLLRMGPTGARAIGARAEAAEAATALACAAMLDETRELSAAEAASTLAQSTAEAEGLRATLETERVASVEAARRAQELREAAEAAGAARLEGARAQALLDVTAMREAAKAETDHARAGLEAHRLEVLEVAHRQALEEAAQIRADAMEQGEALRRAVLEDAHRHATEEANRISEAALAEVERLKSDLRMLASSDDRPDGPGHDQRAPADRIRKDALKEATASKRWSSRRALAVSTRARRRASSEATRLDERDPPPANTAG